jgi:anti-sigma regulatory factor (Ser/Thr protein kinase)
MDGLELVKHIKAKYSVIPVILMTAHGNEETAVKALQIGAASYVPKKNLARDLEQTVRNVMSVAMTKKAELQLLESLTYTEVRFELANDIVAIRPLIQHTQSQLRQMQLFDDNDIVRISTALQEALVNAIEHGNLELRSDLRESVDGEYTRLARERAMVAPYKDRRVHVSVRVTRQSAEWFIRDEGPGYNPTLLPDPRDPANLQKVSGRGLLLIRTFMDEVSFNETANEIRMVKRCHVSC